MSLSKDKRANPTQKHLNSHCYILYKKTFKNVVRSLEKHTLSIKKIQPDSIVQSMYLQMKIISNPKNDQIQQTKNTLKNEVSTKSKNDNLTLKYFKTPQRPKSLSARKTQKLHFLKQPTQTTSHTRARTNLKSSTRNSSQNQNQTTFIKTCKEENNYFRVKCFQSQQRLQKLSKKLHEEKKIHQAQKCVYEERIQKLKHLIENSQKEAICHETGFSNAFERRVPFKVLAQEEQNGLGCCNQEEEMMIDLELESKIFEKYSNKVLC